VKGKEQTEQKEGWALKYIFLSGRHADDSSIGIEGSSSEESLHVDSMF
jgi:hypothetical protein